MQWEFIVALVVAIPMILFPAAFIWYVKIGGPYIMLRQRRKEKAAAKGGSGEIAAEQTVVIGAVALAREPLIGGHITQFDKTFPTLDCAACILIPKMTALGQHPYIKLMSL